jgi:eukaryotic-like serine/threonine-protein kinase
MLYKRCAEAKRGRTRRFVIAVFAGAALLVPGQALGADWLQFHSDASRTGFNPGEATLGASNVSQLHLGWQTTISNAPVSPPVVSGGEVYVGSNDSDVYALNAATGAILWKGATGASIPFSPAVDGSRVFVGSDDGKVYAFPTSCSTPCAPLWSAATGARIGAAPVVANGAVYVGTGSSLWALDEVTGTVRWQATLFNLAIGVAVSNGIVYATDGSLFAFPTSCSTPCAPLWIGGPAGTVPVVGAGTVFSDARYVNNAFNAFPASGSCTTPCAALWTGLTNSGTYHGAAVAGSTVYLPEGDGTLAAFPVQCSTYCTPLWTSSIGGFVSDPSIANGVVYVGTDNAIDAFDANTGTNLFDIPTGATTQPPAIANAAVYASTFDFTTGGKVRAYVLTSPDTTAPVISVPASMIVNATSPIGAVVTYSVSATDPDDTVTSLSCTPASGSTFAIGTTTVRCSATDTNGNTSTAAFVVHVKSAAEQLADLLTVVTNVGPGTSLADKVSQAQAYLNASDIKDACSALGAFIHEVNSQSGIMLTSGQAAALVSTAQRIQAVVGC